MAKPAIEGIQRILRAAEHAGVKRVVMTANFGAVGFSNKDKIQSQMKVIGQIKMNQAYQYMKNQNC